VGLGQTEGRNFPSKSKKRSAENNFYTMQELADAGHDPYAMEKQLRMLRDRPRQLQING